MTAITTSVLSSDTGTRTYCCGYWAVADNQKNSAAHYMQLLPQTLDMIHGTRLHFLSNEAAQIEAVEALCRPRNITFTAQEIKIADLPGQVLAADLVEACNRMALDTYPEPPIHDGEKGMIHYWRDFIGSGPEVYRKVLAIWLSKIDLTADLAALTPQTQTAWIDISVARFNGLRENWDFHKVATPDDRLSHYASPMKFYGAPLPLNASFMCATSPIWEQVRTAFAEAGTRAASMPYAHDEETLLAGVIWRQPNLFNCIGHRSAPSLGFRLKRRLMKAIRYNRSILETRI